MAKKPAPKAAPRPQARPKPAPKAAPKPKGKKGRRTPQAPVMPQPAPDLGAGPPGYDLEYNPTLESQINQPYQDVLATGALSTLPGVVGNIGGQQQMADLYGGAGSEMLGAYMTGNPYERQLTGQFGGQAGGTLGYYGGMMDPNNQIMQGWMGELQDIQAGKADFDPFLTQQFNDQERVLREQLRRNLGPDYEGSSAGIEALAKFNQNKTTTLGSAQFQRGMDLQNAIQGGIGNLANQAQGFASTYGGERGQQFNQADVMGTRYGQTAADIYNQSMGLRSGQLGGQAATIQNIAAQQDLYANVPKTMGQFGAAMTGQASGAVGAQAPFQTDRQIQAQLSTLPSKGEKMGQYMAQSGDRWVQVGSSIGGMGGGASAAGGKAGGG